MNSQNTFLKHFTFFFLIPINCPQSMMKIEQPPLILLLPPPVGTKNVILMAIDFIQTTISFKHNGHKAAFVVLESQWTKLGKN